MSKIEGGGARYDSTLHMFVQTPREPDLRHLKFLRELAVSGKLEHPAAGPPSGNYAEAVVVFDAQAQTPAQEAEPAV